MKPLLSACFALCLGTGGAQGTTLHDEQRDGPLGGSLGMVGNSVDPRFDISAPGTYTVRGTLDGGASGASDTGPDEFDSLQITTAGPFTVDLQSQAGNAVGFLYVDSGRGFYRFVAGANEGADLFGSVPPGPGAHGLTIAPRGNRGVSRYTLTITTPGPVAPVPLPAGLTMLALGLGALRLGSGLRRADDA